MNSTNWKVTDGDYKSEKEEYIKKVKTNNLKRVFQKTIQFVITIAVVILVTYFITSPK